MDFLRLLVRDFGMGLCFALQEDIAKLAEQYATNPNIEPKSRALLNPEQLLRHAIVPSHIKFFGHVSRLPGGIKILIDIPCDILTILSENRSDFYISALKEFIKEKPSSLGFRSRTFDMATARGVSRKNYSVRGRPQV
ncbi:hypothetical protein K457DRAFT_129426 [Linnemannia elongata AG-77]|uniref:Malonyl-CoA decarboxylase N-terminal domain-containing protein n=1 Tax=Linnemannia elongata AG-77 TaxID=1314771 RepID=A0A197JKL1_9FUNG|nr:hypothetical protein K457DRAFT_129426 [Linnemannia elongata AG-77]